MQLKHWPTHLLQYAVACIGLEDNLPVTTAEPATEMISVAAVAPARALTALPTLLHHCLRRLADGSRAPTPEGSLLAFAWGMLQPLSDPLQTGFHFFPRPLPAAPSARLAARFPLREGY